MSSKDIWSRVYDKKKYTLSIGLPDHLTQHSVYTIFHSDFFFIAVCLAGGERGVRGDVLVKRM